MGVKHIHYNKEVKAQESYTHSINIIQIILGIRQNPKFITDINIKNNITTTSTTTTTTTRKHCHESALVTAAHILVCLTKEGKSIEEVARNDFNNNLELVSVWVDYMTAIYWI
jgi:hypothetical protein